MENANGDIPRNSLECQKAPPRMPWNGKTMRIPLPLPEFER
jgi:hypothetical protein